MEQKFKNSTFGVQTEQYYSPRVEVIEMEIEGALLNMSGENSDIEIF